MRILFIYSLDDVQSTKTPLRSWESIQLGISYISSLLKKNGHQTQLLVLGSNQLANSLKLLNESVRRFDPGLVCITTIQSQYPFIEKIAEKIRNQWPRLQIIVGGAYPTLSPEDVIKGPFDFLCIGEGEFPTLELCNQLDSGIEIHDIPNLWIKTSSGEIIKNKTRDFISNLEVLPFPDRDMWKPWMNEQLNDQFSVLLGRGCPFNCTYCSNHAFRNIACGEYVRVRAVDSIIEEISMLQKIHPLTRMYFEIESIAVKKEWMIELCDKLEMFNTTLTQKIDYACNFRISNETVDESLFVALKKAHFGLINIGLESGSPAIRTKVLKRNYSNEDFFKVFTYAKKNDLKVYIFNMVGLPGETLKDHKETVLMNRKCQPDGHYTQIFYPYEGTEIYNTCVQKGYINGKVDIEVERKQSVIEMPGFSKKEIKKAYVWFDYYVYKGYKPLWKILIKVIMSKIESNSTANLLFRNILQTSMLQKIRVKLSGK